jgi:hypothetical protein
MSSSPPTAFTTSPAASPRPAELCGVRPTGEQVAFSSIEINRAGADGKFAEHWSSADLLGVLHRLGVASAHLPEGDSDGFIHPHT